MISVLLEQGLIDEQALVGALTERLEFSVFDPSSMDVEPQAANEILAEDADRHQLLPVRIVERAGRRVLQVAMADPLDQQAIAEIEFSTGCQVIPLIARPSDLADIIRNHYRSASQRAAGRRRERFGGRLKQSDLSTMPLGQAEHPWAAAERIEAVVTLLVRKGLISEEELEAQLQEIREQPPG